jgi:hypothetical protein
MATGARKNLSPVTRARHNPPSAVRVHKKLTAIFLLSLIFYTSLLLKNIFKEINLFFEHDFVENIFSTKYILYRNKYSLIVKNHLLFVNI